MNFHFYMGSDMGTKSTHYLMVILLSLLFLPTQSFAAQDIVGVASVIDADTVEIHNTRIRLEGIDAPESNQTCLIKDKAYRCGQQAALALDTLIANSTLRCKGSKTDRYKRLIAVCYLKDKDINAWLVENGWAIAYRQYSMDYVGQEDAAKANKVGIWRGEFEAPWDFRKKKRHK